MSRPNSNILFKMLEHIGMKDRNYYRKLAEEEQKTFVPLVTMRWLSGSFNERQIYFINELVNPNVFHLHRHKELLYYLMTLCGFGNKKYFWNKTISKKKTSLPIASSIVKKIYGYSTLEALEAMPLLSNDDIMEYAEELGEQPDTIKKLKKELKNR
jgi:hypothetical protein